MRFDIDEHIRTTGEPEVTNARLIIVFAIGLLAGVGLGIVLAQTVRFKPTPYVLKQDLDLSKVFFFDDKRPPVKGVIAAGSRFDVEFRYSSADYIAFRTVVDRETLMKMSSPVIERR